MGYALSDDTTLSTIEDAMVLTTDAGDAAVLNESAALILGLLLDEQDTEAIIATIMEKYDTNEQTIQQDVADLIEDLTAKGMIIYESLLL